MSLRGLISTFKALRLLVKGVREIGRVAAALEALVELKRMELGLSAPSNDISDHGTDVSVASDEEIYDLWNKDGTDAKKYGYARASESPFDV